MHRTLFIILCLAISVTAQEPKHDPSPCAAAELRCALEQSRVVAERILATDALALKEQELVKAKSQIVVEQDRAARLQQALNGAEQRLADMETAIAERNRMIAVLITENDKLYRDLKHARSWRVSLARVFGITR